MASTTPHGQTRYVDFDQYVDSKLSGTRSAIRSTDVMSAIVASSVLVLTYLVLFIIAEWGQEDSFTDVDGDGVTGVGDMLLVLDAWGACP